MSLPLFPPLFFFSVSLSLYSIPILSAANYQNDLLHRRYWSHSQPRSLQNGGYHRRFEMDFRLDPPLPIQIIRFRFRIQIRLLSSFDFITNHQREPCRDGVSRRGGEISGVDDQRHVRGLPRYARRP